MDRQIERAGNKKETKKETTLNITYACMSEHIDHGNTSGGETRDGRRF